MHCVHVCVLFVCGGGEAPYITKLYEYYIQQVSSLCREYLSLALIRLPEDHVGKLCI